jgi:uncharacterized protein
MADRFVSHPIDVVSLWQQVKVKVLEIDLEREKVSLSMKSQNNTPPKTISKPTESTPPRVEATSETTLKGNISWS